jgi:hypothetical protein
MLTSSGYDTITEIDPQAIVASLISELEPQNRKLTTKRKAIASTNAIFSLTLGAFSIFLNKQQAEALCEENFNFSATAAIPFVFTNSSSNLAICAYTGSELFNALVDAFIGKNKPFYQQQTGCNKNSLALSGSILAGLSAAIPVMVTVQDSIGSKLAFTSSFIVASYSFFTLIQSVSNRSKNNLEGVKNFNAALKEYENKLRGHDAAASFTPPSKWVKSFFAIFIPLGYVGPFFINSILIFNDPNNNLKFLNKIFPEDEDLRLVSAISFSGYCTLPWFILAGHFGYHLPEIILQQRYNNTFSKTNPTANLFLQIMQGLISAFTWAIPVKFFLDVYEEFFETCDDVCISFTVLWIAISGILYVLFPNLKVTELLLIFWNIAFSSDIDNQEYTYQVIGLNEMQNRFKDLMINLPANDINDVGKELAVQLAQKNPATTRTSLLKFTKSNTHTKKTKELQIISVLKI